MKKKAKIGRPTIGSQALPVYGSMGACASATGIPLFVLKQAKAEGCEAFRFSRIDLGKLLPFIFRKRKEGEATGAGSEQAPEQSISYRTLLDKYKAWREKIRWEQDIKSVISKDQVRTNVISGMAELYSALDRVFCNELPPRIVGLTELDIRKCCKGEIELMKTMLRQRFAEMEESAGAETVRDSGASSDSSEISDSSETEPMEESDQEAA